MRNWFEDLTGFEERNRANVLANLSLDGDRLVSRANDRSFQVGELELASLRELRKRAASSGVAPGALKLSVVQGDVQKLHADEAYRGALFQVASQFNMLEMIGSSVTPDDGVTRYQNDPTQGPACAIAAGAATIYRNYFAPVNGETGQTASRQLDGLADLGEVLADAVGMSAPELWTMRNGYAFCGASGLKAISSHLRSAGPDRIDAVRRALRIGLHRDVEVTNFRHDPPMIVSQVFCSALPVAYSNVPSAEWPPFAKLVLEAAYEATLWAAVLNAHRGPSNVVLLTLLGGGAFGNEEDWIFAAMRRALELASNMPLDVRIVSYRRRRAISSTTFPDRDEVGSARIAVPIRLAVHQDAGAPCIVLSRRAIVDIALSMILAFAALS